MPASSASRTAAADLGAEHLVVGGGAKRVEGLRVDDHQRLAEGLEKVVAIAQKRGLRAHYHPHLTTIVEGPEEVDTIFSMTSINFCPDTAHLAAAGGNVAAMIRKHHARISYVHLKGWRRDPFAFTPLDEGDLDMSAIMRALSDIRFDGWITAELDSWPRPKRGREPKLCLSAAGHRSSLTTRHKRAASSFVPCVRHAGRRRNPGK